MDSPWGLSAFGLFEAEWFRQCCNRSTGKGTMTLLAVFGTALVAFLVIIDPLGLVPIFAALTRGVAAEQRRALAIKGVLVSSAVLLAFGLGGDRVLAVIGISLPAFRLSGGLLLFLLALEMVFERRKERRENTAGHVADERATPDIAVFPLAVPLIAGAGAITTVILQMGAHHGDWTAQLVVLAALLVSLVVALLSLFAAGPVERLLGPTMISVFSRLLGLLLAALAVQFVLDGIRGAFGLGP